MYLSASNSLSINGKPVIDNFYESGSATAKDLKMVEKSLETQNKLVENILNSKITDDLSRNLLSAETTGVGGSLDILV